MTKKTSKKEVFSLCFYVFIYILWIYEIITVKSKKDVFGEKTSISYSIKL